MPPAFSSFPFSSTCRTSTGSSDLSGHCRASTASSRSQWALPTSSARSQWALPGPNRDPQGHRWHVAITASLPSALSSLSSFYAHGSVAAELGSGVSCDFCVAKVPGRMLLPPAMARNPIWLNMSSQDKKYQLNSCGSSLMFSLKLYCFKRIEMTSNKLRIVSKIFT